MEDKRFQPDHPDAAGGSRYDRRGNLIPEDPTFEEMEETLREIEYFNELTETLLLLEARPWPFRF